MSKAFAKNDDAGEWPDAGTGVEATADAGVRHYISPAGFARLKAELRELVEVERPDVVHTVAWAARNGDRSENGDYIYGKRRLREIDRRVRFLIKRLESVQIIDNAGRDEEQVFFGATVRIVGADGRERSVTIVGADETDPGRGRVSWQSPIATALLRARCGDTVVLRSPSGEETLEIIDVTYDPVE